MTMSRDEIFARIRDEVLVEALGVDEDEITMDASLTRDLEAESIDFLDIQFKLERSFSTDERPFKVEQGELFPENLLENPDWVSGGRFTDAGMAMLRDRMPHVDFSDFEEVRSINEVGGLITVGSIVSFVERKLAASGIAAGA